jgi:serine/threonine protein kinase
LARSAIAKIESMAQLEKRLRSIKNHEYLYYDEPSSTLGKGAVGDVYRALRTSNCEQVALKIITRYNMGGDYSKFVESVTNEIQFLKKCNQYNSPFILKFYEYWIEGNFAYIITEMCDDNLRNRINTVHFSKSKHDAPSPIENKKKTQNSQNKSSRLWT